MQVSRLNWCAASIAILYSSTCLAQAQTPPAKQDQGTAQQAEGAAIDPAIVVTARRRAERLQDVPIAISVSSGVELKQKNIVRVEDVPFTTPGFQVTPVSYGKDLPSFTIRSQRQSGSDITQDLSVGIYFAEVVQAHAQGVNSSFFDLDSVQVLKGPVGTLFGRNATGGAVVITPKAPTRNFEGYATAAVGSRSLRSFEGAVNVPVAEFLQVRIGGQVNRQDGYLYNLFDGAKLGDDHSESWRASFRLTPFDGFENTLVLNGYHANQEGIPTRLVFAGPSASLMYPGFVGSLADVNRRGFYTTNSNIHGVNIKTFNASNITTYETGPITLKNIFGYRHVSSIIKTDIDSSPFSIIEGFENFRENQYSDEFQILGKAFDNHLDYIVGAYYFNEKGPDKRYVNIFSGASQYFNAGYGKNTSKSVFGQVTYRLPFLEQVSLTGGLRETYDTRALRYESVQGPTLSACRLRLAETGTAAPSPCVIDRKRKFNKLTYTAVIDYKITDKVLAYVTTRRGYRSGGFNLSAVTPSQRNGFGPETVVDYELGLKTQWRIGDAVGHLNAAAYHQDYRDVQRSLPQLINGVLSGVTIVNAASATVNGLEVDGSITPMQGLRFDAFYSYSDPKYQSFFLPQAGGTFADISSTPFAGTPKHSGGGGVRYTLPLSGTSGDLAFNFNVYYQSKTYSGELSIDPVTKAIAPRGTAPSYTVENARFEWNKAMGSGLNLSINVKNLFDRQYYTHFTDNSTPQIGLGIVNGDVAPPRTVTFEASYHF